MEVVKFGHIVTLESSLSATTTSKRPAVSETDPASFWQACATACATSSSAAQSSELYVMSLSFIGVAWACSHSSRHTMDFTPEESPPDHPNPTQPPISFHPFTQL